MSVWEIVTAQPSHVAHVATHMREADRHEVWASHRHTPHQALVASLGVSRMSWCCLVEGKPAFMWGVADCGGSVLTSCGTPWLLGTESILAVGREFVRQCRTYVDVMQTPYELLTNYVHAENTVSLRWLKWCGFQEGERVLMNNECFYRFWRVKCAVKQ